MLPIFSLAVPVTSAVAVVMFLSLQRLSHLLQLLMFLAGWLLLAGCWLAAAGWSAVRVYGQTCCSLTLTFKYFSPASDLWRKIAQGLYWVLHWGI